jgi:S-adenosylmethionine:tRNA ribosyltransferase-isomerase
MLKSEFNFKLPEKLIAQTPLASREQSRLLCMGRYSGSLEHRFFFDLPKLLRKGDCLVLNNSRVLPARLRGFRETGGAVEVLLLHEVDNESGKWKVGKREESVKSEASAALWECLVRPGRKVRVGTRLVFGGGELTAEVKGVADGGNRLIQFYHDGVFFEVLDKLGQMPLPHYIQGELHNKERYQTVYSRETGSAAAPTAGLHFTLDLLHELESMGVEICYITLHVGLGTFRPVKADKITGHKMHAEYYTIIKTSAEQINKAKENGSRIIAVGTTSCRALEATADETGKISAFSGQTDIFIYPGYKFKCIDGLITNFHLPESTLIMLVSAFAGKENTLKAYEKAIAEEYRFYSFGDCMIIL